MQFSICLFNIPDVFWCRSTLKDLNLQISKHKKYDYLLKQQSPF